MVQQKLNGEYWHDPLTYFFATGYPYILNLSLQDCGLTNEDLLVIAGGIEYASQKYKSEKFIFLESLDLSWNQFDQNSRYFTSLKQ